MINRFFLIISTVLLIAAEMSAAVEPDSVAVGQLDELVVTGNSALQRLQSNQIGAEHLELDKLKLTPSLGGETDIIKSLSLLPGVRSEGDGGGGFEVRGGNASQNLTELDGITLYNPAHVMGIFSTFNDDALGAATLYKGPYPAVYGGASSSVLNTSLSPGDMTRYHGSATIGILAAKIFAEGPIIKDKLSFAVAARRSYVDAFLKIIPKYRSTVMNFYDVSAKLRFTPSESDMIDAAFFIGHDNMAVGKIMGLYWGNLGGSVNWTARPADGWKLRTTAAVTHFDPKMKMDIMRDSQTMFTYIHNYSLKENIEVQLNDFHNIEFGAGSNLLKVKSAEWVTNNSNEREIRSLWENALWIDYNGNFSDRFNLNAGMRLNVSSVITSPHFHDYFSLRGGKNQFDKKTYIDAEPRISLKYSFSEFHNLKGGFGMSSQNLHAIRSTSTSFPFDRYALTSAVVRPEESMQYGLSYNGMTPDGVFDWSVEGYYRNIRNIYDYKDGCNSFSSILLEDIILGGKGRSYGLELMLRKNTGALTGWISYTLSRTETKIPGINNGRWYNASNDRRHDFSITGIYRFSSSWNLSASWIFMTGQPLTAPDVKYEVGGITCYYYSQRNSYKTPPIHRLDIGATYRHQGKKLTYEWSFGIYNAYCRYNPYIVYFEDDPSKPSGTRAVQQAMYGIIPSVSYSLSF